MLDYTLTKKKEFKKNGIFLATDGKKETLICLGISVEMETVKFFKKHNSQKFICLNRALHTSKKMEFETFCR